MSEDKLAKQDPFSGVYRARTPKELAEMFMNPNAPKTEAEHWAVREIDRLRSDNEKLRAERDALRDAAREYLETLGGAMKSGKFEMAGTAEMAHFVRQAMQKLDSLVFDRDGPRPAGLERLHEPLKRPS
jgi:hypothetical protein